MCEQNSTGVITHRLARFILPTLLAALLALGAALPGAAQDSRSQLDSTAGGGDRPVVAPRSTPPADSPEHMTQAPRVSAVRLSGDVEIDGVLDEAVWRDAPAASQFHQREPVEGAAPSQRTEVRFAYDDEFFYIGARMFDDRPDQIVGRLARRDADTGSDYVFVSFDPYHNHIGQIDFSVNPTGMRFDGADFDTSWDPVWEVETEVDELGWTMEARIPFSQIRFDPGSSEPWGLQIERYVNRLNEYSVWSFWRRDEQGGTSRFGHLMDVATPATVPGRLELLPYVVTQAELHGSVDADDEDPFVSEREGKLRVGADVQYLITSNLTLNATINPDFGQAEVDPAVVNLSAFETFFPEKREFFIEGQEKFSFGSLWCFTCSNVSSLNMLYTRRIGRTPQALGLAADAGDYLDAPDNTTILGAAKLTGRTGGWNIGVFNAVTAREHAEVQLGTDRFEQEVEPATNYFVARASRELRDGNWEVGGIFTSVIRDFDDPALAERLNQNSFGLGFDTEAWWANRKYHYLGQVAFTQIHGDADAILRAQRSSARYFQRPDRDNGSNGFFTDSFEPGLETMRGFGFYSRVSKEAGAFRWETGANVRSPGFENNDIGFVTRTDYMWHHGSLNYRLLEPTRWYRYSSFTMGAQQEFNFDGDLTGRQISLSAFTETPFYWTTSLFGFHRPAVLDDRLTRGGPVVGKPHENYLSYSLESDHRKSLAFYFNPQTWWNGDGARDYYLNLGATWKPMSNVSLSLGPGYTIAQSSAQYVDAIEDPTATDFYGTRYVFADLHTRRLSMDTRLNVTFTPSMSLELFAQPFISSNDYRDFKEFARTRDDEKLVYGEDVGTLTVVEPTQPDETRSYLIDPDGAGPAAQFSIDDPDFNFRSLRGNAVFRWEYTPGSTLYLVWTQDRSSFGRVGDLDFDRDRRALFDAPSDHIFLVKLNYWLPL